MATAKNFHIIVPIKQVPDMEKVKFDMETGRVDRRSASAEINPFDENALEAAGKIHSDLKRGFIKAEVTNCRDLDSFFNMAEARSRGFVKIVGKDYIVQKGDIIEIRFNV